MHDNVLILLGQTSERHEGKRLPL